jgi:diaminopimelate epimerase
VRFVKMHGIGNDYVYVDAVSEPRLEELDLPGLAREISDRHRGVGSDGLILLCRPSQRAAGGTPAPHVRMRMWNSDGSESEMCGNGVRCVAKFAHDRLGVRARPMLVETGRGVLSIDYRVEGGKLLAATVDMGEPILDRERLPVDWSKLRPPMIAAGGALSPENPFDPLRRGMCSAGLLLDDGLVEFDLVSMGNPHAVICTGDSSRRERFDSVDIGRLGPRIERNAAFPQGINVHWWEFQSQKTIRMKTWERGAGPTQACGTGACAVVVAGILEGRLDRSVLVHLPGGDLEIAWDDASNHVFMTGPAEEVFEGEWRR